MFGDFMESKNEDKAKNETEKNNGQKIKRRQKIKVSKKMVFVSYEIRDIVLRAKKVQKEGKKIYWFNIGDPNQFGFKPPAVITNAIFDALKNPKYTAYCPSEGDPDLREAISKIEGVPVENVFITSGLSEGIDFLIQSLLNPSENILLPTPSYPLYITKIKVYGGQENFYLTDENFIPDVENIRKKINKKTKAIIIINPNNPTGAIYPKNVLQEIVNVAGEYNIPIIADEIYDKLAIDNDEVVNLRTLTKDVPLISGNGISKNFIYPGARVGYLALHGEGLEDLQQSILKLCNQRLSVNWEMQRGALAAFTSPLSHLEEFRKELKTRRDIVHKRLNEIKGISCVKPKAAFYSFPKLNSNYFKSDKDFVYKLLDETGVVVVPGSAFSPNLKEKYFRLVFLAAPSELNEAIDKIEEFMKKYEKS
jgi:aspartate/methionine/tyrosine aminotransferase